MPLMASSDAPGSGCSALARSLTMRDDCRYCRALKATSGYHCTDTVAGLPRAPPPTDTTRTIQNGSFDSDSGIEESKRVFTMKPNTPGTSGYSGCTSWLSASSTLPTLPPRCCNRLASTPAEPPDGCVANVKIASSPGNTSGCSCWPSSATRRHTCPEASKRIPPGTARSADAFSMKKCCVATKRPAFIDVSRNHCSRSSPASAVDDDEDAASAAEAPGRGVTRAIQYRGISTDSVDGLKRALRRKTNAPTATSAVPSSSATTAGDALPPPRSA
jgi:hypothetical protein